MKMRGELLRTFVGSQGDHKAVNKFIKSLDTSKRSASEDVAEAADRFFSDFSGGFKGID